jgi:D-3-phosphoglycerate dehydrogenase
MPKPRLLVAESAGFSETAAALLRQHADLILTDLHRRQLIASMQNAEILWVRLRYMIDAEIFNAAPHLRAVVSPTTGLNHIDVEEANRRTIAVLSLRGETKFLNNVRATAEHTMGLALALIRHIPAARHDVLRGQWDRERFRGSELYGKQAGIVGYGRLGRIVASYFKALGMNVWATDLRIARNETSGDVPLVSLDRLLSGSDLVSVHVNFTNENIGLFGYEQFERMKHGAYFINTSRGEVVDETALHGALHSGHLAGAALDVLNNEQTEAIAGRSLLVYALEHDNLLITPHIGGCTRESMEMTEIFLAERLCAWLQEHEVSHVRH